MKLRADFTVAHVSDSYVAIVDRCKGVSITNDAEAVVQYLLRHYTDKRRFFYRDTMGQWDELSHDGSRFLDFAPLPASTRAELQQFQTDEAQT